MKNILAVGAHPDDIDFTSGGTVALLTAQGFSVTYCLVTNGQAGGFDRNKSRSQLTVIRRDEQERAAKLLGVEESVHLDLPDGLIEPTIDLRRSLTRVIRQFKPEIVICPSPRYNLDNVHFLHPDHLAVGVASLSAVYPDSRNYFAFPELGLEPHTVNEVWIHEDPNPDFFVDISSVLDQKLKALSEHSSQFATDSDLEAKVMKSAKQFGELSDHDIKHAEAFRKIHYHSLSFDLNF